MPSSSSSSSSSDADLLVSGDLNKAARVEEMRGSLAARFETDTEREPSTVAMTTPTTPPAGNYDVIDVLAASSAGVGSSKSGQTTRIYTTGEVNDDFWLKHLGDDFKHAIHLQVGGTNEDYNRIVNQTSNGVAEEVHHEYLPGAERPSGVDQQQQQQQYQHHQSAFEQPNMVNQASLDGEAMALKQNYLRQQQRYSNNYAPRYNPHNSYTHTHSHTHHTHTTHTHPRGSKSRQGLPKRYKQQSSPININSSEDTLHTAQSQATPTAAKLPSMSLPEHNSDSQLPFKSAFNDYGSRPTRDLTYLLYKRGL
ncbi:lateral signaling target protein 2 homolog isoform X2 [Drosophila busckii]|nr:lateral signaling target protein 2 homolog isoform X2 [Drosophila busckii]